MTMTIFSLFRYTLFWKCARGRSPKEDPGLSCAGRLRGTDFTKRLHQNQTAYNKPVYSNDAGDLDFYYRLSQDIDMPVFGMYVNQEDYWRISAITRSALNWRTSEPARQTGPAEVCQSSKRSFYIVQTSDVKLLATTQQTRHLI